MKRKYLLPIQFKRTGLVLCSLAVALSLLIFIAHELGPGNTLYQKFFVKITYNDIGGIESISTAPTENSFFDEITAVILVIGLIFIAFSKEKQEDEYISELRLKSLVWATYINYAVLILGLLLIYNLSFGYVLSLNMFTVLIVFIVRFKWELYRSKRLIDEK